MIFNLMQSTVTNNNLKGLVNFISLILKFKVKIILLILAQFFFRFVKVPKNWSKNQTGGLKK
jgi:hypothetical protein